MTTITAKVLSVTRDSKPYSFQGKELVAYKIVVEDKDGKKITIEKHGMADGNFDLPVNADVQVDFESKTGKFGQQHKAKKIHLIQDGQVLEVDARGNPKPAFNGGGQQRSAPATPGFTTLPTTTAPAASVAANSPVYAPAAAKSSSYSSEGARNGMITGKAVDLAIARNETSLEGLQKAADDVKALTLHVETGKALSPSPAAQIASKAEKPLKTRTLLLKNPPIVVDTLEDDESPFSM